MQFVAASKLQARPGRDARSAAVRGEDRRGPRRRRRRARRRGSSAARPARGRHAPDRAAHQRPRPGRLAQHERDPPRVAEIIDDRDGDLKVVTVGRKGHAAMRRAHVPIAATFDGFGERPSSRRHAACPADHGRLPSPARTPQIDLVYPRFVSTLVQRPTVERLLPIEPTEDTRGHPGQPVHLRAERGRRAAPAAAALRRDAPLPGRRWSWPPASSRPRWSR